MAHPRKALWILFALCAIKSLVFVSIVPPWQGPDEPSHHEYIEILLAKPSFKPIESPPPEPHLTIAESLKAFNSYRYTESALQEGAFGAPLYYPPFYFKFCSVVLSKVGADTLLGRLYAARMISCVLSVLTVLIIYKLAVSVTGDKLAGIASCSVAAFVPQVAFLFSIVNPEVLIYFLSAACAYLLILLFAPRSLSEKSPPPRVGTWIARLANIVAIAGITIAASLTKKTGLTLLPFVIVSPLVLLIGKRGFLKRAVLVSAIFAAILLALYSAQSLLRGVELGELQFHIDNLIAFGKYAKGQAEALAHLPSGYLFRFTAVMFVSFWFSFGWMVYKMSLGWYLVFGILSALSALGVIRRTIGNLKFDKPEAVADARAVALLLILLFLSFLGPLIALPADLLNIGAQARYMLSSLPAIAIFIPMGLCSIFPERWKDLALVLFVLFMIFINLISVFKYLIPIFYLR